MQVSHSMGPSLNSMHILKSIHKICMFGHVAQILFLKNTVYRKKAFLFPV